MALISTGAIVGAISGSIGGSTYSHNRSGAYIRNRSIPVNPNSQYQSEVRQFFNALATAWRDALTLAERLAWTTYAQGTVWKNRLGQDTFLSGANHFIRSNTVALQSGEDYVADGPATLGIPAQEELWTPTASAAAGTVSLAFTFPTNVDGQMYAFYGGHPFSPSRNFYGGPWRHLGSIIGDSTTPPTSPQVFTYPWTLGLGNKVVLYCRRFDADGRLTEPFRKDVTIAA